MSVVPAAMPASAPSGPRITERRSSSLPTQENTNAAPAAASRGVGADAPPYVGDPLLGLGGGAVVDGHVVAAAFGEVPGHRIPHDPKADEGDFCHCCRLSLLWDGCRAIPRRSTATTLRHPPEKMRIPAWPLTGDPQRLHSARDRNRAGPPEHWPTSTNRSCWNGWAASAAPTTTVTSCAAAWSPTSSSPTAR